MIRHSPFAICHSLLDRAYGCLAGLALGDAMGCPTEFLTPEEIAAEYGWVEGLVAAPARHPHAVLPVGR
ncbi:MAG: ADP-ribosylglycohydrolase family protein, partial [Chloroflexota bacterium]|nr:ADP-ribosylglycohydrolase family protein [Chloroflexota bacterium]